MNDFIALGALPAAFEYKMGDDNQYLGETVAIKA
jgi:hypothetical protein